MAFSNLAAIIRGTNLLHPTTWGRNYFGSASGLGEELHFIGGTTEHLICVASHFTPLALAVWQRIVYS